MTELPMDYAHIGQWTESVPTYCANAATPHRLVAGAVLNGWAECSCGGHRTVQCRDRDNGVICNAVHYLPRLMSVCSLSGIPEQRAT